MQTNVKINPLRYSLSLAVLLWLPLLLQAGTETHGKYAPQTAAISPESALRL